MCYYSKISIPNVNFCHLFDSTDFKFSPGACQFLICPNSIIQNPGYTSSVVQHLTSNPHELPYQRIKFEEDTIVQFRLPNTSEEPRFEPVKLFELLNGEEDVLGYYVLVKQVAMTYQPCISWTVVELHSKSIHTNMGEHCDRKIKFKFCIKAKPNPQLVARFGEGCVPDLIWNINTAKITEWKEFIMTPIEQRPPFSYLLPLSMLENNYVSPTEQCEMNMSFAQNC